ncbi:MULTISPECIES: Mu transposase C-terminal domain-containing protein [unclassified Mesorhizobium]|uniref:Mu transposase C-terminal domain-containing protein n=1 Tax=unclassified Mesorhizobium TaxID=325217 RepID=UPI0016799AF4|nr:MULTISPECIES: Mu transposase C-terminal domain-containing protein [unclassified Mesorhizobium]
MPERGTLTLSERAWIEAKRRATVIVPLAASDRIPSVVARAASEELGLSERSIYALVRRYRRAGGLLSSLAPQSSPGGRGKARLSRAAEQIIADAIRDEYLTRQKKRAEAVVRAVRERAIAAGITPPAANTVRARVGAVKAELAARRRDGARSAAARRLAPSAGMTPLAVRPMAVLQIDHTPVDLILVDDAYRKSVGRPWLTVAIDVMSRCIAGFLVSFDPPCATSVGLCLTHAALPKDGYLRHLGIEGFDWPVEGKPERLYVDNAAEFHADALTRGCEQHGIELDYRPVATPHFGGIVERLIGTLMMMVHELPGTTFSNPAERGEYDSDATACLTLAELERWLALAIVGRYHNEVHDGIDEPPLTRWRRGVSASGSACPVSDPRAFLVDFLPVLRRPVTREGVRADHIAYYSDALRPFIAARESLPSFVIRRDPRDLSRIFLLDPEDNTYIEVACARQERPSITLFEHRQAVARLKAEGLAQVDEEAIFRAVAEQREVARTAAARTRSARRRIARTEQILAAAPPARDVPTSAKLSREQKSDDNLVAVTQLYPVTRW